jgi:hypothetical protein
VGYFSDYSGMTAEERRMQLLAEMGSPYLNPSPGADFGITPVGPAGMMPQGGLMAVGGNEARPEMAMLGSAYMDPGQRPGGSGTPWVDPGQTSGGSGRDYTDPPPRLGNFFRKPGEPQQPELDGILFNGTRSPAGRDVLSSETRPEAIPSGPIASPPGLNVQGANNQDRSNAPKSPDMPKTATPSLPTLAGGLGTDPAAAYASGRPRVGTGSVAASSGSAPMAGAAGATPATAAPASQSTLPQPQAAAIADGLSRKPGSPAAMNWLSENADLLIGIGAGLLSKGSIGEGIIAGLKLANDSKTTSAKQRLLDEKNQAENLKKAASAALLQKAFGMPSEMAVASADNADLVKRAGAIIYPDPESPDWTPVTLQDGTRILENKRTGDRKADPGFTQREKPSKPLDEAGKARWNIPPDDIRPWADNGDKPPTLIGGQQLFETPQQAAQKAEETGRVNASVDQATKLAANRLTAQTNVSLARSVRDLLGQVEPGAITAGANALRERFGLNVDANGGKAQALQAYLERLANDQHKVGTGAVSDADLRSFQKQVPSLMGTREGNAIIMDTIQGVAEYNDQATALASKWKGGDISLKDMNRQLETLPNPFDRAREYQRQRDGTTTAGTAPTGSGPGVGPAPAAPASGASRRIFDPALGRFR